MNILITGISKGLGKELGLKLVNDGHYVCGIARSPVTSLELQQRLNKGSFVYKECDIRDSEKLNFCLEDLKNNGFIPDVVILCAGIMMDDLVNGKFIYNNFRDVFETNLFANIFIIDRCMEIFAEKKIVFVGISSLSALRAIVINKIAYPASKAALNTAFEAFRIQSPDPKTKFITINLGMMGDKSGLFRISYCQAAEKIIRAITNRRAVISLPFLNTCITRISRFLPDALIRMSLRKLIKNKNI